MLINFNEVYLYAHCYLGAEVIDINVDDVDTVGTITYTIVSGNTGNAFLIDSSGIVTLAANGLDFETVPAYILGIEVSDGSSMVSSSH